MEHWTEGGEGVTNFDPAELHIYEQAIKESGMDGLYISDEGMGYGKGPCFCDTFRYRDLGPFWRIFEAIEEAQR
jgi:hypothetical protein